MILYPEDFWTFDVFLNCSEKNWLHLYIYHPSAFHLSVVPFTWCLDSNFLVFYLLIFCCLSFFFHSMVSVETVLISWLWVQKEWFRMRIGGREKATKDNVQVIRWLWLCHCQLRTEGKTCEKQIWAVYRSLGDLYSGKLCMNAHKPLQFCKHRNRKISTPSICFYKNIKIIIEGQQTLKLLIYIHYLDIVEWAVPNEILSKLTVKIKAQKLKETT